MRYEENPSGGWVNQVEKIFALIKKWKTKPPARYAPLWAVAPPDSHGKNADRVVRQQLDSVLRIAGWAPLFEYGGFDQIFESRDEVLKYMRADPYGAVRTVDDISALVAWMFFTKMDIAMYEVIDRDHSQRAFPYRQMWFDLLANDLRLLRALAAFVARDRTLGRTPPKTPMRADDPMSNLPRTRQIDDLETLSLEDALHYAKLWDLHVGVETEQRKAWRDAEKVCDLGDDVSVHRLVDPLALEYEGLQLRHCIGTYEKRVAHHPQDVAPALIVMSFRRKGLPWFTADWSSMSPLNPHQMGWQLQDARKLQNVRVWHGADVRSDEQNAMIRFTALARNQAKNASWLYGLSMAPALIEGVLRASDDARRAIVHQVYSHLYLRVRPADVEVLETLKGEHRVYKIIFSGGTRIWEQRELLPVTLVFQESDDYRNVEVRVFGKDGLGSGFQKTRVPFDETSERALGDVIRAAFSLATADQ